MLLISTTHKPATDLGYLLHKNPSRIYSSPLTFGEVKVGFPVAEEEKATAALMVEIDPVALVRKGHDQGSSEQYVNDRPYTSSSFTSVALAEAFGTALNGRSKERQELAETPIPLEIQIPVLRARQGESMVRRLFEPLGYTVTVKAAQLDEAFPDWGESPYLDVTLTGTLLLKQALRHLYVLLPVLDEKKHYFLGSDEVGKMVSKGAGWLEDHPEKKHILRQSLGRRHTLVNEALEQLTNLETDLVVTTDLEAVTEDTTATEAAEPKPKRLTLHEQRHNRVAELVRELKPKSVVDLGCGEGKLIRKLIPIQGIERILGMEVSIFELEYAIKKFGLEEGASRYANRLEFIHGSLMYRDKRIHGFDVATVVEVIEHMDAGRIHAFEQVVFKYATPRVVIVTTPNKEYNALYGEFDKRHDDHRFEWTRAEFESWADRVASDHSYSVRFEGIGEEDATHGCPSQMAVFSR